MHTRCPQCKTVHELNAALISHSRGDVKCGECGCTFSALTFLFDDWPAGEAHGPAKGSGVQPPVLGPSTGQAAGTMSISPDHDEPEPSPGLLNRLMWALAALLLFVVTAANAAWTFREPLMEYEWISKSVQRAGWFQLEQEGLLKEPQQIQLISRDIHEHPTRTGVLVLNLTFINLAERNQVYPQLELTLTDAANQTIARRRLEPIDYLRPGVDIEAGLAADVYLPVLLELGDPGDHAVGFEIRFL